MGTPYARAKVVGHKKKLVNRSNVIENIYGHEISKAIADGRAADSNVFRRLVSDHLNGGGYLHARDSQTGETFFHVLAKSVHRYLDAKRVRIFYDLGTKIDLDVQDHLGDTVLHKISLVPGAWRCIVAVQRCGASPLIRNKSGLTPEEQIILHKKRQWEENLYWIRKFSPGLWNLKHAPVQDTNLTERFLKFWCRTSKVIGDTLVSIKTHCRENRIELVCLVTLEKYELTTELALAVLSGSVETMDTILNSVAAEKVNVNTRDHSYQYSYPDCPTAPRPLLAAAWETGNADLVKRLMTHKPDTSVKYTFEAEASRPPKPLFFHLVNPKSRPENPDIMAAILQGSDLGLRNEKGETILFEAIYNDEREITIQTILDCGVNVAARDLKGRTARDHCVLLNRNDYKGLIDSHVIKLATDLNVAGLEDLVLQMYDHIPAECKVRVSQLPKSDQQMQVLHLLKNAHCMEAAMKKLFNLAKDGHFSQFSKLLSPQLACARDKAGRSLLHVTLQSSCSFPDDNNESMEAMDDEVVDDISTISIDRDNQQIESIADTNKLHFNSKEKKRTCVLDRFLRKHSRPDFLSIINLLVKEYPNVVGITNNMSQTALHYAHIYSANKTVMDILSKARNDSQHEDIFGFVPKDYNRDLCGEQTYKCRRKIVDDVDLNIFLTESKFEHHLKKSIQTGQTCKLRCLVNRLMAHGGESHYSHVLFDCLDANRISLASFLIQKGFKTDISKQYDTCNPDNPMCAMMECSHAVTTLIQRAAQVGATDLVGLINKRSKENIHE